MKYCGFTVQYSTAYLTLCLHLYPQTLKDWKLAIGVLVMVVVDLIFLIPLTIIEWVNGYEPELKLNKEYPSCIDEVSTSEVGLASLHLLLVSIKKQSVTVLMFAMKLQKANLHTRHASTFLKLEHLINQDGFTPGGSYSNN